MDTSGADPKCFDLAKYFLGPDVDDRRLRELAFRIQSEIEDWLEEDAEIPVTVAKEEPCS